MLRPRARIRLGPEAHGRDGLLSGRLLTVKAATGYDASTHPDFAAPIYAAVFDAYTGPEDAPPLIIAFASDDVGITVVPGALALYAAWQSAGRPVEMHAYAEGGHTFAAAEPDLPSGYWMSHFAAWLRRESRTPDRRQPAVPDPR